MKSFREQTYYELLEVGRGAEAEEVRAALHRSLEVYAPESVALYALVNEEQADALRSRLQEAARVLLDPAARAGYDRMLGLGPELPPDVVRNTRAKYLEALERLAPPADLALK